MKEPSFHNGKAFLRNNQKGMTKRRRNLKMKIGLVYEDINTGELFVCQNFTYSFYIWRNSKGEKIEEDKAEARKHMSSTACKDKKRVKEFLDNLAFTTRGYCKQCNKEHFSGFKKYVEESACRDENCPYCGNKLKYY